MTKKIITTIAILFSITSYAQHSFEKGTNVIAFGADLGVYRYTSKILSTGETNSDLAVNKQLNLYYERGVKNWLGIGGKVQLSDYFTGNDSSSFKAIDGSLLINAHFVKSEYVDMLIGLNAGYSYLDYEPHDEDVTSLKGGGFTYDIHFQPHFYFGKHIGIFINLAYINYFYKNLDFENKQTKLYDSFDLTGGGVNFGLGLQAKF